MFDDAVVRRIAERFAFGAPRDPEAPFPSLTTREREVLDLVAQGKANPEIAEDLFISVKTVRNQVSSIFTKLGVQDRSAAIVLAREQGLGRPR